MHNKLHTFTLKLLSASRAIGLRRLRSYAASLGGGADMYHDTKHLLSSLNDSPVPQIVLLDGTIAIDEKSFERISRQARIFSIDQQQSDQFVNPKKDHPCWRIESYAQTDLNVYLNSPVCRMNAAQMCNGDAPIQLANLVRWGHAREIWTPNQSTSIAESGLKFIKSFNLVSDWRRSTEMFCHFAEAHLHSNGLRISQVDFASDGLLLSNIIRCELTDLDSSMVRALVDELRVFNFPISAINQLANNEVEIAVYHCPVHAEQKNVGPTVLVYNKGLVSQAKTKESDEELEKAG